MIKRRYEEAKEQYMKIGINTDEVLQKLDEIAISINCWQGDDVCGFEDNNTLSGGIGVSGNHLGRARNISELQSDIEKVLQYLPGRHKLNLHAIYGEFEEGFKRENIDISHFKTWIDFAKSHNLGLDFNPTIFSHKNVENNLSLTHPNKAIRDYWINYCIKCREIASEFAKQTNGEVLNNLWIPDGTKDIPGNRLENRKRLLDSLNKIYSHEISNPLLIESVESKVFGIGIESFTAGSHELYLQYAMKNNLVCLLDNGHYHPSESVADKISSMLLFNDKIALHLTRSVRWDSDHVIMLNDEICDIMNEIAKYNAYDKVMIGLDFFDASINRLVAWIIGVRNTRKAILKSLLMPHDLITIANEEMDYTKILMLNEELKTYPFIDIWNYYCHTKQVIYDDSWYEEIMQYEHEFLKGRV